MPVVVVQPTQVLQSGDLLQVLREVVERPVVLVLVGLPKGLDAQPVLRVHQKVPPNVVEHDGVLRRVELAELAPDDAQWFDLQNSKEEVCQPQSKNKTSLYSH